MGLSTSVWNACRQKIRHALWTDRWRLLVSETGEPASALEKFVDLQPPRAAFWADPFVVMDGEKRFVFFEELKYSFWGRCRNNGRLLAMEFLGPGRWSDPFPVLERKYHLSYPFVFQFEGAHYLIPETMANHTIELYQAIEFPHRWELRKTLMSEVDATDTTLFEHHGVWWMFTCLRDSASGALNRDLHLFFARCPLTSEWMSHPRNPIVSDSRCARPAGRIFERAGELYRPGQDCSKGYGAAIQIQRILRLSETEYLEEPAQRISPECLAGVDGVHTWNEGGGLSVSDARSTVGRWTLC